MGNRTKKTDQTVEYRAALLAERARITGVNPKDPEVLVMPHGTGVDDQAPLMHEQFVALRQRRMDRHKLKLIDAALARLDAGEFGTCEECGEAIPARRLKVLPWAAYCVPCQEEIDRNGGPETDEPVELIA